MRTSSPLPCRSCNIPSEPSGALPISASHHGSALSGATNEVYQPLGNKTFGDDSMVQGMPSGTLVYKEYELVAPDGSVGIISFTLADMEVLTGVALRARQCGARAYGFISLSNIPGGCDQPFVWMRVQAGISVTPIGRRHEFSPELQGLLAHCARAFFTDIEALVDHLTLLRESVESAVNENG